MAERGERSRRAGQGPHRLIVLGCAAAGLSLSITLAPAESSRSMGACAPTESEAKDLRAGSELLLMAAAAQVLVATVALLVPARLSALAATGMAALTAYRVSAVLLRLAGCHGHVRGAHTFHYVAVLVALFAAFLVALVTSVR